MKSLYFVGRSIYLAKLKRLLSKKSASLVVIKGRRRIGKSRLIEEFGKNLPFYTFSGLPPTEKTTAQTQRDEFALHLNQHFQLPQIIADDWSKLFLLLADKVKHGQAIILFDEITWMADKDPSFLAKLKNAWDLYLKKNHQLILILCGSISAWIEKNIISSTGFYGRISEKITLQELSLNHCNQMLENIGFKNSSYEKFMMLSITGGIPWHIEQIDPNINAIDNIQQFCFTPDGLLVEEFAHIFSVLFGRRQETCQKIIKYLVNGSADIDAIAKGIQYSKSGSLSDYLDELVISGFIKKEYTWILKTGTDAKLSQYRLSDNYLRFYLRYMEPKLNRIKSGKFHDIDLSSLPGIHSILGLQFENLVLNNRKILLEKLDIKANNIIYDNPFYQRKTARQKGCQIDYLIQTKFNTLYVCEIKFSKNKITPTVIASMKNKIASMSIPRGFACIPILIHVNGVTEEVIDSGYFGKIINFSDLLEYSSLQSY